MKLFTALFSVVGFLLRFLWAVIAALLGLAGQFLAFQNQQYIALKEKCVSRPFMAIAGAALLVLSGCAAPAQTPTPSSRLAHIPTLDLTPTYTPTLRPTPTHTPTLRPTLTVTSSPTVVSTPKPTDTPTTTPTVLPEDLPATSTPAPTNTPTQTPRPKVDSATASVNLRAGPGTSYPVVGGLEKGDAVQIVGKTSDGQWYRVKLTGGTVAWVASSYIQVETDSGTIPVVASSDIPPTPSPEPTLPPTATPLPPFRPPTGMLEDHSPGGQGKLLIKNCTEADALVILTGLDEKAVKSAYIRNAESFDMTGIPDGTYRLYYSKGEAFNKETNRFTKNATYQRLDATIEFTTSATQYTAWEVTLYGVVGGNEGSEQVDPSKFP